ncbi:MAG: LacI family DNA-binding transcriptional regulator [Firmicutes bacterium]|nr:LacI family DNA-binding transcriptional regulator [Bacillota bacterium]
MATLKEIADKLNVSITTVSRVLNFDTTLSVGDDIRKKIIETATDMNYKTPRNRMRLKSRTKLDIAVIHWYSSSEEVDDPYYIQIRRGIEQLSAKSNINTVLIYKEADGYQIDDFEGVQGIICIGKFSNEQIELFQRVSNNIVFVDSSPNEEVFDSVVIDFHTAVRDILTHLVNQGYRKIGYIGGVEYIGNNVRLGERRELVFRDFLFQRGKLDTDYIHVGKFSCESGYNLMKEALKQEKRAEVYFCASDSIAIGALRAIHEAGLQIPRDIGITGFNDNPMSQYTYPPLSTVHVYTEFMGEQALGSLVERIEGRDLPIKKVVPTKIILRDTLK